MLMEGKDVSIQFGCVGGDVVVNANVVVAKGPQFIFDVGKKAEPFLGHPNSPVPRKPRLESRQPFQKHSLPVQSITPVLM